MPQPRASQGATVAVLAHSRKVLCAAAADDTTVLAGCDGGSLVIWDTLEPDDPLATVEGAHSTRVRAMTAPFALQGAPGPCIATASSDGTVKVWDLEGLRQGVEEPLAAVDVGARFTCLCAFDEAVRGEEVAGVEESGGVKGRGRRGDAGGAELAAGSGGDAHRGRAAGSGVGVADEMDAGGDGGVGGGDGKPQGSCGEKRQPNSARAGKSPGGGKPSGGGKVAQRSGSGGGSGGSTKRATVPASKGGKPQAGKRKLGVANGSAGGKKQGGAQGPKQGGKQGQRGGDVRGKVQARRGGGDSGKRG